MSWVADIHPSPNPIASLSIITVDHRGMTEQNQRILNHAGSTDVISCLYEPMPGEKGYRCDIIVNVELARDIMKTSGRFPKGWNEARELTLYLFHGWDHLCGADDNTVARRRVMRRRELTWVRRAVRAGLLETLKFEI